MSGASDHPRIRGEHSRGRGHAGACRGSSPHTRGALIRTGLSVRKWRIIPAYAGSTTRRRACRCNKWDHPRIRGEHGGARADTPSHPGSSPHTRGARRFRPVLDRRPGIIPAYAGSTPYPSYSPMTCADHPRIRGEHVDAEPRPTVVGGSSPHTRGAHPKAVRRQYGEGIIPAYAGSTCRRIRGSAPGTDHPRIRGEHTPPHSPSSKSRASSPHTRGAHGHTVQAQRDGRIIPAYAGSTLLLPIVTKVTGDHPRIRGEHCSPPKS